MKTGGRQRQGLLGLSASGWPAVEQFIALAAFGTQTAQNSHPSYVSK